MIEIPLWQLALFGLIYLAGYVFAVLTLVLPFAALGAMRRGRPWRAAAISAVAIFGFAVTIWPGLRDLYRFEGAKAVVRASEIRGEAPDLTGKTVAYLSEQDPKTDYGADCDRLLRYSGAKVVYLLQTDALAKSTGPKVELWENPVDLTSIILGEAVLSDPEDSPYQLCDIRPLTAAPLRIDYLVGRDIGLLAPGLQANLLAATVGPDYWAKLDFYVAPVADQHRFLLAAEGAQILLPSVYFYGAGIPAPLTDRSFRWPAADGAEGSGTRHELVAATLCRHDPGQC